MLTFIFYCEKFLFLCFERLLRIKSFLQSIHVNRIITELMHLPLCKSLITVDASANFSNVFRILNCLFLRSEGETTLIVPIIALRSMESFEYFSLTFLDSLDYFIKSEWPPFVIYSGLPLFPVYILILYFTFIHSIKTLKITRIKFLIEIEFKI